MKKTGLITLIMLLSFIEVIAQCTNCNGSSSSGTNASAIGTETEASGHSAFASGVQSIANASFTTAIGFHAEASYTKAVAIGSTIRTTGYQSITLGSGDFSSGSYLTNNIPRSLMVGFNSIYPTLFVVGNTDPQYHNKTGKIGIGNVTEPEAKLHLRADDGEEAAIFIEPHSWENGDTAQLYLGNQANGISADNQDGMLYHTENNHVFKGGDVYIEDINKGIIMKSPDGKCWRGTLDNNGSLGFVQLDACPGQTMAVKKHSGNKGNAFKVYPNPAGDFITVSIKNPEQRRQTIKLLNENGIILIKKNNTGNSTRFYIGDLPSGTYFVQVISGGKRATEKFLKR